MSTTTIILAVALGLAAGVMSGLFGVGGGILFVPLLVALGLGQVEAAATSLLAVVPTAAVGAWRQARYGNLRVRPALIIGVASIVGVEARGARSRRRCPSTSSAASSASCSSASRFSSRGVPSARARATLSHGETRVPPRGARSRRPRRVDRGGRAAAAGGVGDRARLAGDAAGGLDEVSLAVTAPPPAEQTVATTPTRTTARSCGSAPAASASSPSPASRRARRRA